MSTKVFVNLPTADLERSKAFYTGLGCEINPLFTDENATLTAGIAGGGTEPKEAQDYGFMYSRDLEDPDGNILEFMWMSDEAVENGPEATGA